MSFHAIANIVVVFIILELSYGQRVNSTMNVRVKNGTLRCDRKNVKWKLRSLVFYPHMSRIQAEVIPLREVRLSTSTSSSVEIKIEKPFDGYSRYAYHNGTVLFDRIKDLGQVPRIKNGKVIKGIKYESGGYLYAKKDFKKDINSKFTCSTPPSFGRVICKVVLNQIRYQVPFTAFLLDPRGGLICTSYGLWEKLDDPVPELLTEILQL